jgi:hypothetical protein
MRKRYRILIALLVVAIAGVIAREVLRERQPVYQGKKLFYWLMQHAKTSEPPNQNSVAHEAAEIAILHIGTNGLPALLAWASTRDSPLKKKMRTLMSNVVRGEYGFKANDYHAAASYGFGVLKSVAEPAVPGLIKLLNDTDPDIRSGAAWSLGQIGPAAGDAVPALLRSLDDPEAQSNAFAALRSIGAKPDAVVPVLMGYLSSTNMGQQGWALSRLSEFRADARIAIPKVLEFLDVPQTYLRQAATNALKNIDPEAAGKAGVK